MRAMMGVLMPLALLPAPVQASDAPCPSALGAAVPNAETARRIAAAIVDAHATTASSRRYRLIVEPAPNGWTAWQRPAGNGAKTRSTGGGGLSMRIDRCTGAISALHRQR